MSLFNSLEFMCRHLPPTQQESLSIFAKQVNLDLFPSSSLPTVDAKTNPPPSSSSLAIFANFMKEHDNYSAPSLSFMSKYLTAEETPVPKQQPPVAIPESVFMNGLKFQNNSVDTNTIQQQSSSFQPQRPGGAGTNQNSRSSNNNSNENKSPPSSSTVTPANPEQQIFVGNAAKAIQNSRKQQTSTATNSRPSSSSTSKFSSNNNNNDENNVPEQNQHHHHRQPTVTSNPYLILAGGVKANAEKHSTSQLSSAIPSRTASRPTSATESGKQHTHHHHPQMTTFGRRLPPRATATASSSQPRSESEEQNENNHFNSDKHLHHQQQHPADLSIITTGTVSACVSTPVSPDKNYGNNHILNNASYKNSNRHAHLSNLLLPSEQQENFDEDPVAAFYGHEGKENHNNHTNNGSRPSSRLAGSLPVQSHHNHYQRPTSAASVNSSSAFVSQSRVIQNHSSVYLQGRKPNLIRNEIYNNNNNNNHSRPSSSLARNHNHSNNSRPPSAAAVSRNNINNDDGDNFRNENDSIPLNKNIPRPSSGSASWWMRNGTTGEVALSAAYQSPPRKQQHNNSSITSFSSAQPTINTTATLEKAYGSNNNHNHNNFVTRPGSGGVASRPPRPMSGSIAANRR